MATDATITLKGSLAAVAKVEVILNKDGTYTLAVFGSTQTSTGKQVILDRGVEPIAAGNALATQLFTHGLAILLAANGMT